MSSHLRYGQYFPGEDIYAGVGYNNVYSDTAHSVKKAPFSTSSYVRLSSWHTRDGSLPWIYFAWGFWGKYDY